MVPSFRRGRAPESPGRADKEGSKSVRRGRLRNLQDCCYHLTPRCQDGGFLLRFKRDRRNYLARLRESIERTPVDVLDHVHTSNHVHLLLWATDGADV